MKPIYGEKTKICHMNTDSFIAYIKTKDIYVDIGKMLKQDSIYQLLN